jgi:hypothetical protein
MKKREREEIEISYSKKVQELIGTLFIAIT